MNERRWTRRELLLETLQDRYRWRDLPVVGVSLVLGRRLGCTRPDQRRYSPFGRDPRTMEITREDVEILEEHDG